MNVFSSSTRYLHAARLAQSVEHETRGFEPHVGRYDFGLQLIRAVSFQVQDEVVSSRVHVLGSILVSIPACHAGDPGSIPGRGVIYI